MTHCLKIFGRKFAIMCRASALFALLFTLTAQAADEALEHCTQCHRTFSRNTTSLETAGFKKDHPEFEMQHMKNPKGCILCHAQSSPNHLVALDGRLLKVDETPQLCGQCHGPIFFDWQSGLHGKLTGKGTEREHRLLCFECHNPHKPKFKIMKAEPPPARPKLGINTRGHDEHN